MADKGRVTAAGRRGRLFRRVDEPEDQDADLSEDEHAWWAAREGVQAVPRGAPTLVEDAEEEAGDPQFADHWTTESLFDDQPDWFARATAREPSTERALPDAPPSMDLDAAHLILQVPVGADWDDVTAAHRRLAKLYHPDRLVAYSPEAQSLGRNRMAEINAAHAALRSLHFR